MTTRPSYFRVFQTFARNSLVRDMMFPANFVIETVSSFGWVMMNIGFYLLIFQYTDQIGGSPAISHDTATASVAVSSTSSAAGPFAAPATVLQANAVGTAGTLRVEDSSAWDKYQFFVFIATSMLINSIVQIFFMTNADEFSELIRTGGLDFILLKPIDAQFLISLRRVEWSSIANLVVAGVLMAYALPRVQGVQLNIWTGLLYALYVSFGVAILYSLTIVLASASIWLGRNTSIYDFWFYITTFSRYPMEIYSGPFGDWLRRIFTFVLPILIVVNVPARILAKPLHREYAYLALFAIVATIASLIVSRWVFQRALLSYRSASS